MENYNYMHMNLFSKTLNHVNLGIRSKIFYDGQEVHGTIFYEDVERYIKIGVFQNGNTSEECLMIRNEYIKGGNFGEFSLGMSGIRYIHLKDGKELLCYEYFRDLTQDARKSVRPVAATSSRFELLEEKSFSDVLIDFGQIYSEYSVEELLAIYQKYTLISESSEKQLAKAL